MAMNKALMQSWQPVELLQGQLETRAGTEATMFHLLTFMNIKFNCC